MAIRRPRLSLKGMILAIAASGLLISITLRLLKPYPIAMVINGGCHVAWSDRTSSSYRSHLEAPRYQTFAFGPIVRVNWGDGSSSFHLRFTPQKSRPPQASQESLGIPKDRNVTF